MAVTGVSAAQIDTGAYIALEALTVSKIHGSITYVFVPVSQRVSIYSQLNEDVEGGRIKRTGLGDLLKYRYRVNGMPFDTIHGFDYGPGSWENRYSAPRRFFPVTKENNVGVIWQDVASYAIHVTWFGKDFLHPEDVALENNRNELLVATACDESGHIYYVTIEKGSGTQTETARTATLYKAGSNGENILYNELDTTPSGLNIISGDRFTADLAYSNGLLGMMLGRIMHRTSDGLHHQGGIAVVFDADDLTTIVNHGQTSSHSFGNVLNVNSEGDFIGIDLGDNYPRGVNLHLFGRADRRSRVVYTFKTAHGTTAANPAGVVYPVYPSICNADTTYYQWSNDNNTYTELGGVIEINNGYTVVFAGEQEHGKSLSNALTGNYVNVPRNIGLVQVVRDFQITDWQSYSPNVVPDDIVLSRGASETGGFYTFKGTWEAQQNTGVAWITDYSDSSMENVSRLKTGKLADDTILLLWEKWTPDSYINTYALKIAEDGTRLSAITELGPGVRLNRRDDMHIIDNTAFLFSGKGTENILELIVLHL